jgi:hypothetical protein
MARERQRTTTSSFQRFSFQICRWPCQFAAAPIIPNSLSLIPLSAFPLSSLRPCPPKCQPAAPNPDIPAEHKRLAEKISHPASLAPSKIRRVCQIPSVREKIRRLDLSPPTTRQINRKDRESPDSPDSASRKHRAASSFPFSSHWVVLPPFPRSAPDDAGPAVTSRPSQRVRLHLYGKGTRHAEKSPNVCYLGLVPLRRRPKQAQWNQSSHGNISFEMDGLSSRIRARRDPGDSGMRARAIILIRHRLRRDKCDGPQ